MTEKEKALAGMEFRRGDPQLKDRRDRAEKLCFQLNALAPDETEKRRQILEELIPDAKKGGYHIKSPFICEYGDYVSFGRNFFVNCGCKLMDGGPISFGDDVLVGPDCTFVTVQHPTDPQKRRDGWQIFKPIRVGNNVWFGARVTVCPGVTIGDDCVIAAGSVVVRDIPAGWVAAGCPCRPIHRVDGC